MRGDPCERCGKQVTNHRPRTAAFCSNECFINRGHPTSLHTDLERLYLRATEAEANMLDALCVKAGLRWQCKNDNSICTPGEACEQCGSMEVGTKPQAPRYEVCQWPASSLWALWHTGDPGGWREFDDPSQDPGPWGWVLPRGYWTALFDSASEARALCDQLNRDEAENE